MNRAVFERVNWWLRDVVSAAYFANVNSNGNANYNNASNSNGVRPDFGDEHKPSIGGIHQTERKGCPCCKAKR